MRENNKVSHLSLVLSAFASAYGVGLLTLLMLPFLMGAMMDGLGLSEGTTGLILSVEFTLAMVSSLLISPYINRVPRRTVAVVGTLMAIAANILSAYITDVALLISVRAFAGFGAGLALAAGNSVIASAEDPDKTAGQVNVLFVVLMIVVMLGFGFIADNFGLTGTYYGVAATYAVMLIMVIRLPQYVETNGESSTESGASKKTAVRLIGLVPIGMMITMFLFSMRDTMGWAFVEQIGVSLGYTTSEMGMILALQAFIALIGPLIVAKVGNKFGITIPVLIGIIGHGSITLGYLMASDSKFFYTAIVLMNATAYFYALAYLTGLAASLDKEGRVVAATGSFIALGIAVGPAFAGQLIDLGGYGLAAWSIIVVVALTVIAVIPPLKAARAKEREEAIEIS
ncbi:MFS transporter [Ignatzschineria rhizosphaerae]|uniref:MFS transporter n=1 Tax=Ignatzschineria rhizosphaerae TaxID=2923279 RepID=A0ABY3WZS5_9GAMM|nr:MFS transporter [Ignatzschineria rhizosphaerae]UNM94954.1 MFS transporter [Ignatzschineria rhizosphaerae]